ncbi:MAG: FliG C-terminal domain-containing protein [Thermoguttaceae bacterium]
MPNRELPNRPNFMFPNKSIITTFGLVFAIVLPAVASGFEVRSDARYADAASCRECHDAECAAWNASDHHRAMSTPTGAPDGATVLGDFNNVTFVHFGFDDILTLSDAEAQTLVATIWDAPRDTILQNESSQVYGENFENYDRAGRKRQPRRDAIFDDLALALCDAKDGVSLKLVASMTPEQQQVHAAEVAFLKEVGCVRAGDIAAARHRINRAARRLIAEGKIATPQTCRVTKFSRDSENFVVETDDENGETKRFTITGAIGVRPLQQYLVELDRGRTQVLPIAWDAVCGEWFHLYPKEQINADDPLHWTRQLQNANSMCADCHTTDLQKRFDVASQTYDTNCVDTNVGCQSCHGPCGQHVANARTRNLKTAWDDENDLSTFRFTRASSDETIDSCAACHARRRWLTPPPRANGKPLLDVAIPELLDGSLYYADGQLREEAFEYTSFLQAKMWAMGVRCTDCHDPHTAQLVRSGNRLCTQCHSPQLYDTPQHHFHTDAARPGTQCVECHMPETTFMVVDPRRDHSIRKPRPDWTVSLGVPNACNDCHHDRSRGETAAWAAAKCDEWYRARRETNVGFTSRSEVAERYPHILAAGHANATTGTAASAAADLASLLTVTNDKELRPIVRASAAILLGRQQPPLDAEAWTSAIRPLVASSNPLLRYAATVASELREPLENVSTFSPLLTDSVRGVRCEAARVLASVPKTKFSASDYRALPVALKEYIASQDIVNDQAAAHLNVAVVLRNSATPSLDDVAAWLGATQDEYRRSRRPATDFAAADETARLATVKLTDPAAARYRTSLKIDPDFIPSRINLAMLQHERGEVREAELQFREVLRIDPTFGDAAYSLGLLLAEQSRWAEAAAALREAARLMPHHARVRYNLELVEQKIAEHEKQK